VEGLQRLKNPSPSTIMQKETQNSTRPCKETNKQTNKQKKTKLPLANSNNNNSTAKQSKLQKIS